MTLSSATAADCAPVIALWDRCGLTRPWNDPQADFHRALDAMQSTILLWREDDMVSATVMVGWDGHRGWVYYLAVDPGHRRRGRARTMMAAAEAWLVARGVPKLQFMVRDDNEATIAFYERLGYTRQAVVTMGRFLHATREEQQLA